jgi:outer membrane protein OmpA-like peptidoglycan-associated protein/tetratricopeptide (TPR) repeat protein
VFKNENLTMKNFYSLLIFVLISSLSFSQSKVFKENVKLGDEFFEQGPAFHRKALINFLRADSIDDTHPEIKLKIGICYLNSFFKYKAKDYFQKAYSMKPDIAPDIHYYLGQCEHLDLNWDKAKEEYEKYRATLNYSKKEDKTNIADVEKKLAEIEVGKILVKKPVRVFIDNLGPNINGPYTDYSPVISADEDMLMFTSRRNNTTGGALDENYDEFYEDIFRTYSFNNTWSTPINLGEPVNTKGHDATINLSADGQKLLVYIDDKGFGNIYESILDGEKWTKPESFSKQINSKYHESSACYSYDGNILYFVSDRENGFGGSDIYYCKKDEKGQWDEAINIGTPINTKYDEESVFMMPDGKTMYFSSKGHETMGGFDIFKSVMDSTGKWSQPVNIGYPVNSSDDDVSFVLSADGKHGYYAAVKKEGYGNRDIYLINFLGKEKSLIMSTEDNLMASLAAPISQTVSISEAVELKSSAITLLKGIVIDENTRQPIEAVVSITDNSTSQEIANFKSNSKTGKYLVTLPSGKNYGIAVKNDNYLFHSENFDIPFTSNYQEIAKDVTLKSIAVGSKIVLKNVFYDFDKATLRSESQTELNLLVKLLNDIPKMTIELSSHTDNKGSEKYNLDLSDRRSKAVVEYLINKGIDKKRVQAKGYGFSDPLTPNDTEAGRQMNRRTEFKILSR